MDKTKFTIEHKKNLNPYEDYLKNSRTVDTEVGEIFNCNTYVISEYEVKFAVHNFLN
jgi:hypothetical protein